MVSPSGTSLNASAHGGACLEWLRAGAGAWHAENMLDTPIFEESDEPLDFVAAGNTDFLLGSTVKHQQELILGYSSLHSSVAALERGKVEVERVGRRLVEAGKIDAALLERDLERMRPGSW